MAEITAQLVKQLKDGTGCGIMDCKKALIETNGDLQEAVTWLRKKGMAKAEAKIGRIATDGLVSIFVKGSKAAIIELNAETDFIARNAEFQVFCTNLTKIAYQHDGNIEAILQANYDDTGKTVADELKANIAVIGENIQLRRAGVVNAEGGLIVSYIHNSMGPNLGKIGVLLTLMGAGNADQEKVKKYANQLAMHIAAVNPIALNSAEVPASVLEYEKSIYVAEAQNMASAPNIIEKIVEGKIRKFYGEKVLLEQPFVMDNKLTIREFLEQINKELNSQITIKQYLRYQLGEGIEKPQTNFAEDVKAALK